MQRVKWPIGQVNSSETRSLNKRQKDARMGVVGYPPAHGIRKEIFRCSGRLFLLRTAYIANKGGRQQK